MTADSSVYFEPEQFVGFTVLISSDENLLDPFTHFQERGTHVGDLCSEPEALDVNRTFE